MKKYLLISCLALAMVFPVTACTNMSKTEQGTLSGGVAGAAVGAGISAISGGSGTVGAVVGGALGAVAGGLYGHSK